MNRIQLSDHFTYGRLIRFTLPSILMMIFTSIYGVVDGFFVSNFVGSTPFAALNLIMPFIMLFSAIGFMFGAGGSALTALTLGTGKQKKANEIFSLVLYTLILLASLCAVVGFVSAPKVAQLLGATREMLPYCVIYARVSMLGLPAFMLQNCFQTFLITAERPRMGLLVTVLAGVTNMILDALFMGVFRWGIASAAAATIIGQYIGAVIPLVYFLMPNRSRLRLGGTHFDGKALIKVVTNGSSEFLSNVSMSVVNMLYNWQLMRIAGENGVSAYGIIMYTNFIFVGVFFGYSMGMSPIAGYDLGAQNTSELQNVFKRSIQMIAISSVVMTIAAVSAAGPLASIFAGKSPELFTMTTTAIRLYSLSFLIMGFNIFGSAFFTAMNNGAISALISFLRTLLFQVASVLLLPLLLGINGIWLSIVTAECMAFAVTLFCFIRYKNIYHYA
ncbi:MAG: MATE family efflux transporter [Eubacterium sp.]|nr:MATE family efflux transporter [Eubacterium sp.]